MTRADLIAPSFAEALQRRLEQQPDAVALHYRTAGNASFLQLTWRELAEQVASTARGMASLGLQPGQRVASWSKNRAEWVICDLAMMCLGLVHVPIHRPLSPQQAAEQIRHSEAALVWVEDEEQARQLRDKGGLPNDLLIASFDRVKRPQQGLLHAGELMARVGHGPTPRSLRWQPPAAEQPATILYTSGTTGEPKGVMLSHDNLLFTASQMERMFGSIPGQRRMNLLPFSHVFARTCDLYVWLLGQSELAIALSRETACDDCAAVAPHVMNAVPYFFQKLQQRIEQGAELPSLLGTELEYCCVGGAPLAGEIYDFFASRGLPLLQGYGLTESSPVIAACTPRHDRRGSVGRPLPTTEVRIRDGEIQTRGRHVMQGYYKDPAATAAAYDHGWLRTGDLGRLDEDNFLFVTGRCKEMIVLSTGKNVAPALIESLLVAEPWFEQVMVVGDNRGSLGALIVLSEAGEQETGRRHELIRAAIDRRLEGLSRHEQVRRCAIMPRPFSLKEGELTAKLSLRRDVIVQRWGELIERLYQPN